MTTEFNVEGMSCDACVRAATNALQEIDGVVSAWVSLAEKRATVTYDPARAQTAQMVDALAEEGYEARPRA